MNKKNKNSNKKKKENTKKNITNKKEDKEKKKRKKHKKLRIFFMILIVIIFLVVIITSAILVANFKVAMDEFDTDDLVIGASNSTILDSEGNIIATLNGDEKRKIISINDMSEYLPKAYIAIEDERFEQHRGVDFKRTSAAILNFVTKAGSTSFGGSTITQQLVKNATSNKEKTINRKLKEWARAYKVETVLSKDQILETYLNIIFVGQDYYGVELGAKYYFNKTAKDLTIAECAYMAGINNSPNAYKPFVEDPEGKYKNRINNRTKTVLNKMKELNYINTEEYNNAIAEVDNGLAFSKGETVGNVYSYHTDALISTLIDDISEARGLSKAVATSYLYGGGLTIHSTQVASIQNKMEEEYKKEKYIEKSKQSEGKVAQSAMVVIDHKTGYVLGCVGGIGEKTTSRGLNRATQLPRQTGSSFKPLAVVGPALQEGIITAASKYDDSETTFPGGYTPKNYNYFRGPITVRQAIETSQNIPFIKIMQELKVEKSKEYLQNMGITTLTDEDCNLSMAIGGLYKGVTTLEMCAAYATIANDGEYIEPTFYTKIEDSNGNVVIEKKQEKRRVFDEDVDYILKSLIQEPVLGAQGTAKYCAIPNIDVAAKTGTTNKDNDRWLCGFTPYYTATVWYGYDEAEKVRSGSNPAGLIWSAVMSSIHTGLEGKTFNRPSGIVEATICNETGLCVTESCGNIRIEKFTTGSVPSVCGGHQVEPVVEEHPTEITEIEIPDPPIDLNITTDLNIINPVDNNVNVTDNSDPNTSVPNSEVPSIPNTQDNTSSETSSNTSVTGSDTINTEPINPELNVPVVSDSTPVSADASNTNQ